MNDLMNRGLPKWPQMIVTGKSVSEEQALEIIRRTDDFFGYYQIGNNHQFIEEACKIVGMPSMNERGLSVEESHKRLEELEKWLSDWGVIETEYVTNSWISCPFIGGPHGWMHPDGTVGYCDNVGKWPSVEEVYNEWAKIAEAFPFLELEATLMSGEECEEDKHPVVSFLIRNGEIKLIDPKFGDIHKLNNRAVQKPADFKFSLEMLLNGYHRENAISLEQLQKWADERREEKK